MTRTLLVLLALLALALVLGAALRAHDDAPNAPALERLALAVETRKETVAAVSVTLEARGVHWLFARSKGRWRAREAFGAFLDERAFQAWFADVLDARGVRVTEDGERSAAYGFATGAFVRLALHGPKVLEAADGDLVCAFELAHGRDGRSFARRAGESAILELDRDLFTPLGSLEPGALPPLVDRHLLAASIDADAAGFRRITIERRGSTPVVLTRADADATGEKRWKLGHAGREQEALPWRAGGFVSFLLRAEVLGFGHIADAAALGLDAPWLELVLEPDQGEQVELAVGERTASNEAWVWNRRTNVLMRIDDRTHADLAPEARAFLDPELANPWERWLQNLGPTERR